jgi:hypothetical protein
MTIKKQINIDEILSAEALLMLERNKLPNFWFFLTSFRPPL